MNLLFDIGHPGHVHLFRNSIAFLRERGHQITVTVKDLSSAKQLLESYGIPYIPLGHKKDSIFGKGLSQLDYNLKTRRIVRKNRIDLGVGSSITLAHVSRISRMKSIVLDDDDDDVQPLFVRFAHPWCDTLLSPESVRGNRKKKDTLFYKGFHELAYLHPDYFQPDPLVLKEAGLEPGERFIVVRFNVFKAHHDLNVYGLDLDRKIELVRELLRYGKVLITTERDIEPELEPWKLTVSPEKIHSLLYHASMFIGDSQTMTTEAAVLGTPSIRCNTLVNQISNLNELEDKYELTYGFHPTQFTDLLKKISDLAETGNLSQIWQERRERLLNDKINTTAFLIWFIDNYPESKRVMKDHPDYQYTFK